VTLDSSRGGPISRFVLVGLYLVFAPLESAAQTTRGKGLPIEAGAFAGANVLDRKNGLGNAFFADQVPKSSALFGVRGAFRFTPRLAIESELSYAPTRTRGDLLQGRPGIGASIIGVRLHGRYTMFPYSVIRPMVVAGVGINAVFSEPPQRYGMNHSDVDPAAYWGIGGEYDLGSSPLAIRADVRQGIVSGRQAMSFGYEATLGVTFDLFRGKRQERARLLKERAAKQDADSDGVLNGADECPTDRETYNGIDDSDGCPELDRDHDGRLGSLDKCPERAEDIDGFEDADGCPDPDNDRDEIADTGDRCPNAAETKNGFEDADGCPDEVPLALRPFTGVVAGVQFEANSATIYVDSIPLLDEAVAVFRGYPTLGIEVHGHTDPFGTNQVNTDLSLERAVAVKAYLVDHGIASGRILTFGHGANQPIASNNSPEGRAKNRRIEFRLRTMSAR